MDKLPKETPSFFSRYILTIVMVPSIIALHIGWIALQKNRALVKEHEEMELPAITFYKYLLRAVGVGNAPDKVTVVKNENSKT